MYKNCELATPVLILVTNDDGIYAPGLAALAQALTALGEVQVVAPATEQSGVGHSITYLTPLIVKEVYVEDRHWGWAVEGSPADCVKLGITEFCRRRPDLIVSGINSGLNAGINVLYSGTVAAAVEGAFFGITSVAVSLAFADNPDYSKAARVACDVIEQLLAQAAGQPQLFNMNIPLAALNETPQVRAVPMDVTQYGERYERRIDPWGREYFWATGEPPPGASHMETDLSALAKGFVTVTPLDYNLTRQAKLAEMQSWSFALRQPAAEEPACLPPHAARPVVRTTRRLQRVVGDRGASAGETSET